MKERKTQIGMYEALACNLALESFAEELRGSDMFLFVDNTEAQLLPN